MENETLQALLKLKSALDEDPRVLALAASEKALGDSEEARALKAKVDEASEAYSFNLNHFGEESEATKSSLHELFLAKKALDENPVARQYNSDYAAVRKLYGEIDSRLIGPYRASKRCKA